MDINIANLIVLAAEEAVEHAAEVEHAVEAEGVGGVIGTLGLNWKLFLAQALNFSVILFVLWKWVFRPVSNALESRRQKIEESIKKAETIESQMKEADTLREQQLQDARRKAEEIIERTNGESEKNRQAAIVAAREEAEKVLLKAQQSAAAEREQMLQEVKAEVADLVVAATEKIIAEKLDEKKDREYVNKVIHEIQR